MKIGGTLGKFAETTKARAGDISTGGKQIIQGITGGITGKSTGREALTNVARGVGNVVEGAANVITGGAVGKSNVPGEIMGGGAYGRPSETGDGGGGGAEGDTLERPKNPIEQALEDAKSRHVDLQGLMGGAIPGVEGPDFGGAGPYEQAQARLLQALEDQAAGKGPSLADQTLKMGTEANIKAALAQAASTRGGYNPAIAKGAINTVANINQQAAAQAATAKLQEQMAARGLISNVAQAAMTNVIDKAKTKLDADKFNASSKIQVALEQGKINQAEAKAQLDAVGAQADMDYKWTTALEEFKIKREQNRIAARTSERQGMGAGVGAVGSIIGMML